MFKSTIFNQRMVAVSFLYTIRLNKLIKMKSIIILIFLIVIVNNRKHRNLKKDREIIDENKNK